MGARTIHSIVKPLAKAEYAQAIKDAVAHLPGPSPPDNPRSKYGYTLSTEELVGVHSGETLVVSRRAWRLAQEIAVARDILFMDLRMQEGDHWDFTLCRGTSVIADFSTRVGYFEENPDAVGSWKFGDLQAFASAWGIDPQRVAPYLIDWDAHLTPFKNPGNTYEIFDVYQIFDFMRVLGIRSPFGHDDCFLINVPCWEYGPRVAQQLD